MAQQQLSYNDVAAAAEKLVSEGRAVGTTKVREVLGRGSFSTVQKHLSEWEAKQAQVRAREEEARKVGPPEEFAAEFQKLIGAYWPHAVARAKEELRPEVEALQAKLAESSAQAKEAMVEMGNLENRLEAALVKAARVEDAERRAAEANERIITMQTEFGRLEKIETRFEDQRELIQTLQEQVRSLGAQNAELSEVRRKLEAAQGAAARADELEKRATEATKTVATLQAELSRLEKIEARGEARIAALQEQNAALTQQAELLRAEVKEAGIKLARLEIRLETAAGRDSPEKGRGK